MGKHHVLTASRVAVVCSILLLAAANVGAADARAPSPRTGTLLRLAEAEFPNLTRAERALLEFTDIRNHGRGEFGSPAAVAMLHGYALGVGKLRDADPRVMDQMLRLLRPRVSGEIFPRATDDHFERRKRDRVQPAIRSTPRRFKRRGSSA